MSNPETDLSLDETRPNWRRRLGLGAGVLLLLLFVAYFFGTSSFFLRQFVLPKVSKSLNAQLTVGDASISPFSKIVLTKVLLRTTGAEPLLAVEEVRVRLGVFSLLSGAIRVDELAVVGPRLPDWELPN